jgi:hypothetical protein
MLGLLFAILLVIAVLLVASRRRDVDPAGDEPWRASLREEDDEPLDIEEIRRAEAEWAAEGAYDWEDEDESWRG